MYNLLKSADRQQLEQISLVGMAKKSGMTVSTETAAFAIFFDAGQ